MMFLPLAFAVRPGAGRWRAQASLTRVALLLGCAALTVLPWTIRNAIVMHRLIPVSDESGMKMVGTYNPTSAAAHPVPWRWHFYIWIDGESALRQTAPK